MQTPLEAALEQARREGIRLSVVSARVGLVPGHLYRLGSQTAPWVKREIAAALGRDVSELFPEGVTR